MDSRIKQFAEQAGWMMGDGPEGFNTRLERFAALITEEAADEIKRLRQQNAELMEALRRIANDQDGLDVWSFAEEAIAKATGGE